MRGVPKHPGWFSRLVAACCVFGALVIGFGPTVPLTLGATAAIGITALIVSLSVTRLNPSAELVTSLSIPVLGLLVVLTPVVTIVEIGGLTPSTEHALMGIVLGITAATAGAMAVPLAVGVFRTELSRQVYTRAGQLLIPLNAAVLVVLVFDRLRIFALAPPPLELYAFFTVEPAESSDIAALLVTSSLAAAALAYFGFLLGRPLAYGFLYPEERDGRLLGMLVWLFYRLALTVLGLCWLAAFLVLFESTPPISYPAGVWLFIETTTAFATNTAMARLAVNTLLISIAATVVATPVYAIRWIERTGTLWLVRFLFSGALALALGLGVTYLTQQQLIASETATATLDTTPGAWTVFEWLPVIFTAIPLIGTTILFGGSLVYVWFFQRESDDYSLFITYRNVGLGALLFSLVIIHAIDGSVGMTLTGVTLVVIAWDAFEYGYTLQAELPEWRGFSVPEVVHSGSLSMVLAVGTALTVAVERWLTSVVTPRSGTLLAAFVLLVGVLSLLFALRE